MEELRSTDVLDKEILEDARKKARRILKTAEDALAASAAAWEERIAKDAGELQRSFASRTEKAREELMARLPLDKRRAYSEKVESLLRAAMQDYLLSLPREKLLVLLEKELRRCAEGLPEAAPDASPLFVGCRGLAEEELKILMDKALPGISWTGTSGSLQALDFHKLPGSFPAIIVDSPAVRLTASLDALAAALLEDSRAELVSILLGPSVLEGGGQ
jgi:type VI protein secretion system component VasK